MSEITPATRALLERARGAHALDAEHRARLRSRIGVATAAVGTAGLATHAVSASVRPIAAANVSTVTSVGVKAAAFKAAVLKLGVTKLVAATVLTGAIATGGATVWKARQPSDEPLSRSRRAATVELAAPVRAATPATTPDLPTADPAAAELPPPLEMPTKVEALPEVREALSPHTVRQPPLVASPSVAQESDLGTAGNPIDQAAIPPPSAPSISSPSKVAAAEETVPKAPEVKPRLALLREATLLGDAGKVLKDGDARRALALLDAHANEFPKSSLGPERSLLRVRALCALGRLDAAKSAARDLRSEARATTCAE